jgi:hypothetical protein
MRNESVQIHDIDTLMQVFDNIRCPYWGLYSGKNLMTSYNENNIVESRKILEDSADLFAGKSAGRYTLVIYQGLKPGQLITNKTEYTNSIDFRFNDNQQQVLGEVGYAERYGHPFGGKELFTRLDKLNEENARLRVELTRKTIEGVKVEPKEETWSDKIGGIVDALGIADVMPILGTRIVDLLIPAKAAPAGSAAGATAASIEPPTQADKDKIADALAIMRERVTDLPDVLLKFARFSQSNPDQFQLYINAIRNS